MPAVQADFFRKKSRNAAVQATFPQRHVAGEDTATVAPIPWDQKIRGAHFSLGIVAGERFVIELTPSTFPQRHFAGDKFPQRHVAGEKVGMLLGKASNVVVLFLLDIQVKADTLMSLNMRSFR
ncbi:hypothetical protein Tco_0283432 [Tanacetum coccineum]